MTGAIGNGFATLTNDGTVLDAWFYDFDLTDEAPQGGAKGTERLRITPSPYHDDGLIDRLAEALLQVWERLGLALHKKPLAAE